MVLLGQLLLHPYPTSHPCLAFRSGGNVQLSSDGSFLACLYDADVSFVDVEEGVVTKRLTKEGGPGAEEEIVRWPYVGLHEIPFP